MKFDIKINLYFFHIDFQRDVLELLIPRKEVQVLVKKAMEL